ncbi:MAG: hypothetical protein IKX16_04170 [Clostridia bacterium]|nr:hypothetical protein [Clostridia bacterium]
MQRIPTKNVPMRRAEQNGEEHSPLLKLARRIREEQGVEQVKSFLIAMKPFAAPNEIKHVADGFGIEYGSIESASNTSGAAEGGGRENQKRAQAAQPINRMKLIQTMMQLSNAMKNGGADPIKLLSMLNS